MPNKKNSYVSTAKKTPPTSVPISRLSSARAVKCCTQIRTQRALRQTLKPHTQFPHILPLNSPQKPNVQHTHTHILHPQPHAHIRRNPKLLLTYEHNKCTERRSGGCVAYVLRHTSLYDTLRVSSSNTWFTAYKQKVHILLFVEPPNDTHTLTLVHIYQICYSHMLTCIQSYDFSIKRSNIAGKNATLFYLCFPFNRVKISSADFAERVRCTMRDENWRTLYNIRV